MPDVFGREQYDFFDVALVVAMSQAAKKLGLSGDQTEALLRRSISSALAHKSTNAKCTIFIAANEYHTAFSLSPDSISFDEDIQMKEQIHLSEVADSIKIKYKNLFIK
jgi:hypothetical protein